MRALRSAPAEAIFCPLGLKATASTGPLCPSCTASSAPLSTSHTRTTASAPAEPTCSPFDAKATAFTAPRCPLRIRGGASPSSAHSLTLPSAQPAATWVALTASAFTTVPASSVRLGAPLSASHSRMVPLPMAATSSFPSGAKARLASFGSGGSKLRSSAPVSWFHRPTLLAATLAACGSLPGRKASGPVASLRGTPRRTCPEAASHALTTWSAPAARRTLPSALKARALIALAWPSKARTRSPERSSPVRAFHRRTILSPPPVASPRPSGE
jgi:hypothetical protein